MSKDWTKNKAFQKEVKRAFQKAETDYVNTSIEKGLSEKNARPFWRYIKSKKQDNTGVSPLLREGQLATDSRSKAEILLQQFSSVFTKKMTGPMPIVQKQVEESLENMKIDKKGVQKLLQNINPSKASGPDEIPNIVLKECSNELSVAVTFLFQKSLNSGSLPDDWKNANVAPIYKKK